MPTFKHPCPHCGKFIERDAAACPYCATRDPFAPARCPNCRTVIEDPSWLACPRCGGRLRLGPHRSSANEQSQDDGEEAQEAGLQAIGHSFQIGW